MYICWNSLCCKNLRLIPSATCLFSLLNGRFYKCRHANSFLALSMAEKTIFNLSLFFLDKTANLQLTSSLAPSHSSHIAIFLNQYLRKLLSSSGLTGQWNSSFPPDRPTNQPSSSEFQLHPTDLSTMLVSKTLSSSMYAWISAIHICTYNIHILKKLYSYSDAETA